MSDEGSTHDEDLRTLLSTHAPIDDWTPIYQRVKCFPQEARQRYYRKESPLQLSLKLREMKRTNKSESLSIKRIQVLQLIVDADRSSLTSLDAEGRTALHTACSAGRSWEILQLLVEAEDELLRHRKQKGGKIKEQELVEQRSAMLKTDQPGGNLPLHLVAACPSFDESSFQDSANFPYAPFDEAAIQCSISQSIISAYNATTIIREAYPQAVWDRDCDGEIPLHAAASWGNLGSCLSLLMGATLLSVGDPCAGAKDAAQTIDDSNKTPLDRACERVCAMCVHEKPFRAPSRDNFRASVTREDPFMSSDRRDRPMNRNIRLSVNRTQSRRRIPGVGSSFRSSFASTSTADPSDITMLRDSFISSRQPVDPILGLKPLCDDGHEEFAKVEMLARAAQGHFNMGSGRFVDSFPPLLHAIIELGCPPELVWHSAAKYPHEVEQMNESGKSPLFLAAEKLSNLLHLRREKISISNSIPHQEAADAKSQSGDSDGSEVFEAAAVRNSFMQSFFLGNDVQLNLDDAAPPVTSNALSPQLEEELTPDPDLHNVVEEVNQDKVDADILMYQEILDMLIKSRAFGKPAMASIPDRQGRLAIHVLLEAGAPHVNVNQADDESKTTDTARQNPHIINTLIDANPQSLLVRDYKTGLFPFMIAATSNTEGANESTRELETIFRLLLESTEVISYCIQ